MLCDVLLLADPVLHLSQAILSAEHYCRLTDCVLKQIECSTEVALQPARELILRIRTRRLYRLVEEVIIPLHLADLPDITADDILSCAASPSATATAACPVRPCDVQVQNLRISYAMKEQNPVDFVRFFDKSDVSVSYRIAKSRVSHVMPETFSGQLGRQRTAPAPACSERAPLTGCAVCWLAAVVRRCAERILRVYLKDWEEHQPSKPKFEALKALTAEWLRRHDCVEPLIKRTASGALTRKTSFLQQKSPAKPSEQSTAADGRHSATAALLEGVEEEASNGEASHFSRRLDVQSGGDGRPLQAESATGSSITSLAPSSLKRKRGNSFAASDADGSSGECSPVVSQSERRRSLAPFDSPSATSRRSSMDPPSPHFAHTAHAPYHVNPTLACHFPTSTPQQQTANMGSPAQPNRSHSPLPHSHSAQHALPHGRRSSGSIGGGTGTGSGSSTGGDSKRGKSAGNGSGGSPTLLSEQTSGVLSGAGTDGVGLADELMSPHSPSLSAHASHSSKQPSPHLNSQSTTRLVT